jgi:hypothetical protein
MLDKYEIFRDNVTIDKIIVKICERITMTEIMPNVNLIEHILLSLFGANIKNIVIGDCDDETDDVLIPSDDETDDELMINLCDIFEKDTKGELQKKDHVIQNITDKISYDICNDSIDLNINTMIIDINQ